MPTFDEAKIDLLARLVAATSRGPRARRELLVAVALDDPGAETLRQEVEARLRSDDAEPLRARFREVYAACVAGREAPPPARSLAVVESGAAPPSLPGAIPSATCGPSSSQRVDDVTQPDRGVRRPALPFAPAGAPQLTLEQIAAYHAELSLRPNEAQAVAARHGLADDRARAAVETYWAERLRDALLKARHDAIVAASIAELAERPSAERSR